MRLRNAMLAPALLLPLAAIAAHRAPALPAPQNASVTAACTPNKKPFITPQPVSMKRTDNLVWRSVSPNAASWTVTPKDTLDWLFKQRTFTGTPGSPATTPQPLPSAKANHPYHYEVTIVCKDGTTQTIDPDIIISTS